MKNNISYLYFIIILITAIGCVKTKPDLSKIDSWNKMILERAINNGDSLKFTEDYFSTQVDSLSIGIMMELNERNIKELVKIGLHLKTIQPNLITVELPMNKLLKVTSFNFVKNIKIFERRHSNIAFPDTIQSNLFIGIIDVGFGFNKNNFKNRIFSYWDQTPRTTSSGTDIKGLNYGIEYGPVDILNRIYEIGYTKLDRHGSLCSIIAGGNDFGWLFDNTDIDSLEFGKVKSPLIIVETSTDEGDVIDALNYIKLKSKRYHSKCVINLSYSNHSDPHDGSSFLTRAIDNIASDSCIVVVSSGNDGKNKIHNNQSFKDSINILFNISKPLQSRNVQYGVYINSYYNKNKDVLASLYSPDSIIGKVKKGSWENFKLKGGGVVSLINGISSYSNNKNDVLVVIQKDYIKNSHDNIIGQWKLKLESNDPSVDNVDTWIGSQVGYICNFTSINQCFITSSNVTSATKVLNVGGYYTKGDSLVFDPDCSQGSLNKKTSIRSIAPFSIIIPRKEKADTVKLSGTSYSSPLVVRTIAKIWEKYPKVKGSEILKYLNNKAIIFNRSNYNRNCIKPYDKINWSDIEKHFKTKNK